MRCGHRQLQVDVIHTLMGFSPDIPLALPVKDFLNVARGDFVIDQVHEFTNLEELGQFEESSDIKRVKSISCDIWREVVDGLLATRYD